MTGTRVTPQADLGWGAKVVDRLAADLTRAFPLIKGFSPRNLKYMRAFADAWPDEDFVQQAAARLPWFHNVAILERVKEPHVRRFYVEACAQQGARLATSWGLFGHGTQQNPIKFTSYIRINNFSITMLAADREPTFPICEFE